MSRRTEDAIARLCVSLEQSFLEEQRAWREQERLDRLERVRLGLEGEGPPFEEAPPYTVRDENPRQPTPEPQYHQPGLAEGLERRNDRSDRNGDSTASAMCCRSCVCTRCGSPGIKCPTVAELDDTRVRRVFIESGVVADVVPRRRKLCATSGPLSPGP